MPVGDRLCHAQNGSKALLDIFYHPFCFLQLALQILVGAVSIALQDARIQLVDFKLGNDAFVQAGLPHPFDFFDDHFMLYVLLRADHAKGIARSRVEAGDQLLQAFKAGFVAA